MVVMEVASTEKRRWQTMGRRIARGSRWPGTALDVRTVPQGAASAAALAAVAYVFGHLAPSQQLQATVLAHR